MKPGKQEAGSQLSSDIRDGRIRHCNQLLHCVRASDARRHAHPDETPRKRPYDSLHLVHRNPMLNHIQAAPANQTPCRQAAGGILSHPPRAIREHRHLIPVWCVAIRPA